MATFSRSSRMIKQYDKTDHPYTSFGPIGVKPKRIKVKSFIPKRSKCKKLFFMLGISK